MRQPLRHDFSWIARCRCISPDSARTSPAVLCQSQCREVCLVDVLVAEVTRTITVLFWHSTAGGLLASTLTCRRHKLKYAAEGHGLHQEHRIRISGCRPVWVSSAVVRMQLHSITESEYRSAVYRRNRIGPRSRKIKQRQ